MELNYDKEIDALREQMENLQNMVATQLDGLRAMVMELFPNKPSTKNLGKVHVMHGMHPDSRLSEQMEELCYKTEEKGRSGLVAYLGVYSSGERQSNWIRNSVPANVIVKDAQQKGAYIIQPHRVQGVIMLLTGISDMVDETRREHGKLTGRIRGRKEGCCKTALFMMCVPVGHCF